MAEKLKVEDLTEEGLYSVTEEAWQHFLQKQTSGHAPEKRPYRRRIDTVDARQGTVMLEFFYWWWKPDELEVAEADELEAAESEAPTTLKFWHVEVEDETQEGALVVRDMYPDPKGGWVELENVMSVLCELLQRNASHSEILAAFGAPDV